MTNIEKINQINEHKSGVLEEIRARARSFNLETLKKITELDCLVIENAMLIGYTMALKHVSENEFQKSS